MSQAILREVESKYLRNDLPPVVVGDEVDVHVRIVEGTKERVQVFSGVVIKINGGGVTQTMTVRRIVANEGVERTWPIHSPRIAKIEITRHGQARRSRLYFLRDRVGKSRRLADRTRGLAWAPLAIESVRRKAAKKKREADKTKAKAAKSKKKAEENAE